MEDTFFRVSKLPKSKIFLSIGDIRKDLDSYKMCADLWKHRCLNHVGNKSCFSCGFKFFIKDRNLILEYVGTDTDDTMWWC